MPHSLTGAYPSDHGMVGNVWLDRGTGKLIYNVEDAGFPLLTAGAGVDEATGNARMPSARPVGYTKMVGSLHHRSVKIADLVIAAAAEAAEATVLHYDADYDRIAEITSQPVQWIAPRGSL